MKPSRKYEITREDVIDKWAKNYPKVMTWLSKIQAKEECAWRLWLFCKLTGKRPDELLALKDDPRSREAEYLLDQFVADESLDLTNAVKVNIVITVKSFFKHNYRELAKASGQITFIKKKPYRKHTKEELLKIYRACQNPRDRSIITFTWSSAIAKESISKIRWKHLEPDWEKQEIPHIALPDVLIKGHGRGKYKGVEQHTFLTPEAKRDLIEYREYLEKVKAVKITPEDYIWRNLKAPYNPLGYQGLTKVCEMINQRLKHTGITFSWHDARRYVETALEETKINPNWARKIRGRKVKGEEAPYSRPAIEQLRAAYKEAVPLIEFTQPTQLIELQRRQQIVEALTNKLMRAEPFTEEDHANVKRYGIQLRETARTQTNGGTDCQRIVPEEQLEEYLRRGWRVVTALPSGKIVISNEKL